jgi:hypothetical protein
MKRLALLSLLFATAAIGQAAPFGSVLLPIFLDEPVHGALGSVWTSQLSMHNSGSSSSLIEWCSGNPATNTACILILLPEADLEPGETQHVLPAFYPPPSGATPGRVVFFYPKDIDQLAFNLRVSDTSRDALSAGTELPVVRDKDFRTATTRLLNIPIDPRFRLTFRLYQMNSGGGDYTLRVFDEATSTLLGSTAVHIDSPDIGLLQLEPGYLELGDVGTLVPAGTKLPAAIQIEVEPLTAGSTFWTFVSVTNNSTQQLTLVTPQ